jgi:phosphatidate cytidylyltransferase
MIGPGPSDTPSEASERGRGHGVTTRLVVAPLVLAVVAGVFVLHALTGSAVGTQIVLALFAAAAGAEMALLLRRSGRAGDPAQAAVGCALLAAVGLFADLGLADTMTSRAVVLALMVLLVLIGHLRDTRPEALEDIAFRLVPLVYVGLLFSFLAEFTDDWRLVAWIVLSAKASDMAGWAVGVPWGRHKMMPSVSPGKSWEGTAGGLLASALVAVALPPLLGSMPQAGAWPRRALFGLLLGAASILAGLIWSGWKRRLRAKDSSALIPEMGGVMDMLDSLLLAGPVAYAWSRIVW